MCERRARPGADCAAAGRYLGTGGAPTKDGHDGFLLQFAAPGLRDRAQRNTMTSCLHRSRRPAPRLAAICTAALATLLAACESAPPAAAGAAPSAGGSAAQAHARLIDAYNACNEAAFVNAFAPLFTFTSSTTRQPLTTREGLQRYLAAACAGRPHATMVLAQQSTRVSGAITVFAGQYRFRLPSAAGAAAATVEVVQNFTAVFERMGERWLVLAQHISVAP